MSMKYLSISLTLHLHYLCCELLTFTTSEFSRFSPFFSNQLLDKVDKQKLFLDTPDRRQIKQRETDEFKFSSSIFFFLWLLSCRHVSCSCHIQRQSSLQSSKSFVLKKYDMADFLGGAYPEFKM